MSSGTGALTVQYRGETVTEITQAISAVLNPPSTSHTSQSPSQSQSQSQSRLLPVPPILSIIADYASFLSTVCTLAGDGTAACVDGPYDGRPARFSMSRALVRATCELDEKPADDSDQPLLVVDIQNNTRAIRVLYPKSGRVRSVDISQAVYSVYGMCADPLRPGRYYTCGDTLSILDISPGTNYASQRRLNYPAAAHLLSGAGSNASTMSVVCNRGGDRLYTAEFSTCVLRTYQLDPDTIGPADSDSEAVPAILESKILVSETTHAPNNRLDARTFGAAVSGRNGRFADDDEPRERAFSGPRILVWDTASPLDTVLYFSAGELIWRYDTRIAPITESKPTVPEASNSEARACALKVPNQCVAGGPLTVVHSTIQFDPWSLGITSTGMLIAGCIDSCAFYAIDPRTGDTQPLTTTKASPTREKFVDGEAANARFAVSLGLFIDEQSQTIIISDSHNKRIRKLTLPPRLFWA